MSSLPVNDDRVRGCLVPVSATFLLTAAAGWAEKETEKTRGKKSQRGINLPKNTHTHKLKQGKAIICLAHPDPQAQTSQSAKTRVHTKEA